MAAEENVSLDWGILDLTVKEGILPPDNKVQVNTLPNITGVCILHRVTTFCGICGNQVPEKTLCGNSAVWNT